ncbi:MAG TPA: DUF1702 family protein [Streptosporangiaceae bacterium]|jgi:hypothetical protein
MAFVTGRLIHKLLAPPASEVTFLRRGFHAGDPQAIDYLEQIGCWFLVGLEYGMTLSGESAVCTRLDTVPWEYRGFAYEGASMALTILDGLLPAGGGRLDRFIAGPAARHVYMAHVGAGWALARLPRVLQWRIRPGDPLLSWLMLDGYGFHEAYFRTPLTVGRQRPPEILPGWRDRGADASHVIDQGIGRALWFVCGADASRLAATIADFAPGRREDLWAGTGLAATYAGYRPAGMNVPSAVGARPPGPETAPGAGEIEASLRDLAARAGPYLPDVAQGAAFAAKARSQAGLVTPHTVLAVRVLCGMEVAQAARCTDDAMPADVAAAAAYQTWRRQIRQGFTSTGR